MRIKNKLITVQIILILTILFSILIFSSHVARNIEISNSRIELGKADTAVKRFKTYIDTTANKRLKADELSKELRTLYDIQGEYLLKIRNLDQFKTSVLKDEYAETIRFYNNINITALSELTNLLNADISDEINHIIVSTGIIEGIKKVRSRPELFNLDSEQQEEIKNRLSEIYAAHVFLGQEYSRYLVKWNVTLYASNRRLNTLNKFSLIRTIILLILLVSVAFYLSYRITHFISTNLKEVNTSLAKMTNGDFSSTLHIPAGDEFGDLSRRFNQFIQQLWKKLDSMSVIMKDIGSAMNEDLNLTKIQGNILSNVTNHIISDASAIFTITEEGLKMTSSKGHFPPFYPIDEDISMDRPMAARYLNNHVVPLDTPVVNECLENKAPIIIKECLHHEYFPQCNNADSSLYIHSFMMVPLINASKVIGVLVVIRSQNKRPFSDLDYSNFVSLSDYSALTLDTLEKYNELLEKFEMQKEIGVAADIQNSLIPEKMPVVKGLTSSAFTLAAKGVSGDYYDFFRMNKHTIGATVCDVAGKGVPASLVMVMIRTILRLVSSPTRGAAETLTMLNKSISGKIDVDRYATMGFFKIDLEKMKLSYTNAAHHPIQIFRQSTQKFYAIDSPGLPVGIDRDAKYSEKRVSIYPGDIIFMYTDGFPEARNHDGDEYSTSRMLREIRLHCRLNAKQILDAVINDMHKFTARAKQHDDQTILIIKIDEEKK